MTVKEGLVIHKRGIDKKGSLDAFSFQQGSNDMVAFGKTVVEGRKEQSIRFLTLTGIVATSSMLADL
jgi:hypothetical protein